MRRAMLRIHGYEPTIEFSVQSLEAMRLGVVYEDDTLAALKHKYGSNVQSQVWLGNDNWSCFADMVLYHKTDEAVIVEHKATNSKWWNYKGKIPDPGHLLQLWLYGRLYEQMFGIIPSLILFYRSWGHYAELTPSFGSGHIRVTGTMDDLPFSKLIAMDPLSAFIPAEEAYLSDVIPPVFEKKHPDLCLFRGKPSCPMYYHCWKD